MRTLVLAISIFGFAVGAAVAADMPVKTFAAPTIPSWAGFYIGGHGGYGWKDDPFSFPVGTATVDGLKARGWVAGGQVGYNWQYGSMVGGLELDVSATGIKGNSASVSSTVAGFTMTEMDGDNVKLLGSARGRLGFAPNADWLLYGTGGLAWERVDQMSVLGAFNAPPLLSSLTTSIQPVDLFGWALGAGVEARIMRSNWIARIEYLHYDFGHSRAANSTTAGFPVFTLTQTVGDQTIDIVRVGLSYKFGS